MFPSLPQCGIRDETVVYISVILMNVGRAFGIIWSVLWLSIFPPTLYGTIFGLYTLSSLPFAIINQPMYEYSVQNGFDTMNFVQAGLTLTLSLSIVAVVRTEFARTNSKIKCFTGRSLLFSSNN